MSKIILELSDNDIKIKLDELIGERVQQLTDAYISEKIASIINTKLERMDPTKIFEVVARQLLVDQYGEPGRYNSGWGKTINAIALTMLNDQFTKSGINIT